MTIKISEINHGARINLDLIRYCQTFNDEGPKDKIQFQKEKSLLRERLTGLTGALVFEKLLQKAIQNRSASEQEKIKEAPAIQALEKNRFIELLKNSIDAMIDQYLANEIKVAQLELDFIIKTDRDNISVTISDNCGGFSKQFLDQNNEDFIQQGKYMEAINSPKKIYHFGGMGRGIPMLLAYVMKGADKVGTRETTQVAIVPEDDNSAVVFKNNDKGAVIEINTPLAARKPYKNEDSAAEYDSPVLSPLNLGKRKNSLSISPGPKYKLVFFSEFEESDQDEEMKSPSSSPPSKKGHFN